MATTITQAFEILRERLEITGLQKTTVATRQTNVREVMEAGLTVVDSFLAGSYARSSMISPLKEADVDICMVLDAKYFHHYNGQNGGQAGLLDLVRETLRRTYTRTPDISRNGQAVSVRFEDFVVDVVPAFARQGGGYLIPNSLTQVWLETDPKKHVEIFADANAAHSGSFIPLLKMVKGWNRSHSGYFRSFHLEVLALEVLRGVRISDMPSGARYVFDKGREAVARKNLDPAGFGDDVGRYIYGREKIEEAVGKFQKAFEGAVRAGDFARRGYIRNAIEVWGVVFGDYFPTYG